MQSARYRDGSALFSFIIYHLFSLPLFDSDSKAKDRFLVETEPETLTDRVRTDV